jgi:hypothetical protein
MKRLELVERRRMGQMVRGATCRWLIAKERITTGDDLHVFSRVDTAADPGERQRCKNLAADSGVIGGVKALQVTKDLQTPRSDPKVLVKLGLITTRSSMSLE